MKLPFSDFSLYPLAGISHMSTHLQRRLSNAVLVGILPPHQRDIASKDNEEAGIE